MEHRPSNFITILRRLPLFRDLGDSQLNLLAGNMTRYQVERGAVIFTEGDECRELLIVDEGVVKIVKSALNGRQQLLSIERKGSSLAEIAAIDGGRYPASAEAASPVSLLRLPADRFRKICVENPAMALKVFGVLGNRIRHMVDLIEQLSATTVRNRLISYLIGLAGEGEQQESRQIQFELLENNEELAVRLGTVRELISRNLGRLHGDGLIVMNRRTVTIPDLFALKEEISRND